MKALLWKSNPSKNYTDLLPSAWFENEGEWSHRSHDTLGPQGGRGRVMAWCSLLVRGDIADMDYGGKHTAHNLAAFYIGTTRLVFENASRRKIKAVHWRDAGDAEFEKVDFEWRDLPLPLEGLDTFDPLNIEDGRKKIAQMVSLRQGQTAFRNALLDAYDHRCAITGCAIDEVLEAAHISPYLGDHTNHVTNGLLLRADVHTLFDRGLIRVDKNYRVTADSRVAEIYAFPRSISLPTSRSLYPNRLALDRKWKDV